MINELFNKQQGCIHQQTIEMFYPHFDSFLEMCDDAKIYPVMSRLLY